MNKRMRGIQAEIKRCKNIKILILDIAIVIAVLVLGGSILGIAELAYYESGTGSSLENLAYSVEREDYAELLYMCQLNGIKRESDKDFQEFYALADYYEAATWYKAYLETGDSKRTAAQKEKMDAAALGLGRLSATKSRVDAQLGL